MTLTMGLDCKGEFYSDLHNDHDHHLYSMECWMHYECLRDNLVLQKIEYSVKYVASLTMNHVILQQQIPSSMFDGLL